MIKNHFAILLFVFLVATLPYLRAQTLLHPYISAKSHETLQVDSVVRTANKISFYLHIENKIEGGGWFCASKHIEIVDEGGGMKWLASETKGIPVCPEAHKFTHAGEKLDFVLIAPAIPPGIKRISIRERCAANCFYLEDLVLDAPLNNALHQLERGIVLYRSGKLSEALPILERLREVPGFETEKEYGYVLYLLPRIYYELKRPEAARKAFDTLLKSGHPEAKHYIGKLEKISFFAHIPNK